MGGCWCKRRLASDHSAGGTSAYDNDLDDIRFNQWEGVPLRREDLEPFPSIEGRSRGPSTPDVSETELEDVANDEKESPIRRWGARRELRRRSEARDRRRRSR